MTNNEQPTMSEAGERAREGLARVLSAKTFCKEAMSWEPQPRHPDWDDCQFHSWMLEWGPVVRELTDDAVEIVDDGLGIELEEPTPLGEDVEAVSQPWRPPSESVVPEIIPAEGRDSDRRWNFS